MTGAQAIASELKKAGITTCFCFPGGTVSRLLEAIDDIGIRVIVAVNEAGAGHMAQGFFRASGKMAAVVVTSGPGVTNVLTSVADAFFDYDPVVFLCGQASEDEARRGEAWSGQEGQGGERQGQVGRGTAWHGWAGHGGAGYGGVRHGEEYSVRQRGFQWVDSVALMRPISVWSHEPNQRLDGLAETACRMACLHKGPVVLSLRGDLLK